MPSYISGDTEAFGLKAICMFSANTAVGKDTHQGAVMLFSADTGELLAVVEHLHRKAKANQAGIWIDF